MKAFVRAGFTFVAALSLAACGAPPLSWSEGQGDAQPSFGVPAPSLISPSAKNPATRRQRTSSAEHVAYRFKGGKNGANPDGVVEADVYRTPMLFGTTYDGGTSRCRGNGPGTGCGTIYGIAISGKHYPFLFRFPKRGSGGASPEGGLFYAGGETFFGTTAFGGSGCNKKGCGTVFALVPFGTSSTYVVLHKFAGGSDGEEPLAVVPAGNMTYGVTLAGGGSGCGGNGCGTVFSLNEFENESVFSFSGGAGGYEPNSLLAANGDFFGTTRSGGVGSGCAAYGCGTIFEFSASSGTLTVLYSFKGGTDGANPKNLIDVNGELYGTTSYGGGSGCGGGGCGTVFKVNSKTGAEEVLDRFQGGDDGVGPNALLDSRGTLYGTTYYGGSASACSTGYEGCGTIFKIAENGTRYSVLYRFQGGSDGAHPTALSKSKSTLYGTTWAGGGSGCNGSGCGTVFEASP
jgi:uncharacterized repeat protein (TIGR03803 family)